MEVASITTFEPLHTLLSTRINEELLYAVGYALGTDTTNSDEPIRALFDLLANHRLAENLLYSISKHYITTLTDLHLLFRDSNCIVTLWKLYLTPQTDFIINGILKKPMHKLLRSKDSIESPEDVIPYAELVLDSLLSSALKFPHSIRFVYKRLVQLSNHFTDVSSEYFAKILVTSTYFLRVLCPQLIQYQPKLTLSSLPITPRGENQQKRKILLAKLLQLFANNPSDIREHHSANISNFVEEYQLKFGAFCKELIEIEEPFESPFMVEITDKELLRCLQELYNSSKRHLEDILIYLEDLSVFDTSGDQIDMSLGNQYLEPKRTIASTFQSAVSAVDGLIAREYLLRSKRSTSGSHLEEYLSIFSDNTPIDINSSVDRVTSVREPSEFISRLTWLQNEIKEHSFTIMIFYRGLWCPFCRSYLRHWSDCIPIISAMGGTIFGVSTEPIKPHLLRRRGIEIQLVNDEELALTEEFNIETYSLPLHRTITKPAVVVVARDGSIIYNWRSISGGITNFFGERDRITPKDVLSFISSNLDLMSKVDNRKDTVIFC